MTDLLHDEHGIALLASYIASPPPGSVVIEYDRALAQHIIADLRGRHNRHEKSAAIKRYAADMTAGQWALNGSTIVFTDRGLLGDGQNRMLGCIRSGVTFSSHTIFGVPHQYFFTMDQGRVRNPDDILQIEGVPNARVVAQAVRWAELLENNRVVHRSVFTPPDILRLYRDKHRGVEDFLPEARAVQRLNRQPVSMVMALLYSFTKIDRELAADFASAWAVGTREPRFAPISSMQTEVERLKHHSMGRVHDVVRVAMIINTWNAVRLGKAGRGSIIRWNPGLAFPRLWDVR